jgi:SpoIID/LytB domain protein
MDQQPEIQVGIMAAPEIRFQFSGRYLNQDHRICSTNEIIAKLENGKIVVESDHNRMRFDHEVVFTPEKITAGYFTLRDVVIGINFHWEQKLDQQFRGKLRLIVEGVNLRAVNIVPLEEYLRSVISSEMSATSSPELLKAHAVISRSWLLAQMEKTRSLTANQGKYQNWFETGTERIRWYDREDHRDFDVCADDHCQRYQGISRIISEKASQAIDATFGLVLKSDDRICDARFSKCCGGISENFELVWEPVEHPYLKAIVDFPEEPDGFEPNLRSEAAAEKWIRSTPPAFCNTHDQAILSQVLPDFDQATRDFFRWKVTYSQDQISELVKRRTGIDFGKIVRLEPVERGYSGRLVRLKIVGTLRTMVIGKELEIRKALSDSHLYSSAFVIDHLDMQDELPQKFVLTGAGWGHGVGLCQIGAAVMGEQGYSFEAILHHYFRNARLEKLYKP